MSITDTARKAGKRGNGLECLFPGPRHRSRGFMRHRAFLPPHEADIAAEIVFVNLIILILTLHPFGGIIYRLKKDFLREGPTTMQAFYRVQADNRSYIHT